MKKVIGGVVGGIIVIGIVLVVLLFNQIVGTNNSGYYQIKQAFGTGKMSVVSKAGMYNKTFGKMTEYKISDTYYFSKSELDGGNGSDADPIGVRFAGGGTALIDGNVKYRLPIDDTIRLNIHQDFTNYRAVQNDLIRQYVAEALKATARIFKPEDTYAGKGGEFIQLFEEQLNVGIYQTKSNQIKTEDADGNELVETVVEIVKDESGEPRLAKVSPFKGYKIELIQVGIKDIDYDDRTDALILKKQEAEQQKIVARASAEKAKQDAITAQEQGKAKVAEAEAQALVAKKTAIVNAEREKEVAELEAQKIKKVAELKAEQRLNVAELDKKSAEKESDALLIKKEAEAKANELLVKAGLTPLEKAQIEKDIAIGVAKELAKVNVPNIVVGGGNNGSNSPLDALGIKMLMEINEGLSKQQFTNILNGKK